MLDSCETRAEEAVLRAAQAESLAQRERRRRREDVQALGNSVEAVEATVTKLGLRVSTSTVDGHVGRIHSLEVEMKRAHARVDEIASGANSLGVAMHRPQWKRNSSVSTGDSTGLDAVRRQLTALRSTVLGATAPGGDLEVRVLAAAEGAARADARVVW